MKKRIKYVLLGVFLVALLLFSFHYAKIYGKTRGKLNFQEHLDSVAVTVDGEDITLRDLTFYVLFEEQKVEEQARLYNPDSPKDYWNAHTNGEFFQESAKETVIGMAIHDKIMLKLAQDAHVVLNTTQKEAVEEARTKFWSSLFEEQLELLPLDYAEGNRIIKEIAIIEAYQHKLADSEPDVSFAGLSWNGYDFEQILKEHEVKYNKKIWSRVIVGDISIIHENVSYINGLTDEERAKLQEKTGLRDRLK